MGKVRPACSLSAANLGPLYLKILYINVRPPDILLRLRSKLKHNHKANLALSNCSEHEDHEKDHDL